MKKQIVIIGGGVAGLVAAFHCEEAGYHPVIIEADDRAGGRLKTDEKDGFLLDHGFQVLLTAYKEAQRYLDYNQLKLSNFSTGAIIKQDGQSFIIADPIREPNKAFGMLFSPVGSIKDKWLTYNLTRQLKGKEPSTFFGEEDPDTLTFLKEYGFSNRMIEQFFKPFFGGIFLENELSTKAGMFKFVFKHFSEGMAALPTNGIQAISDMLKAKLKRTTFQFNTKALAVEGTQIKTDKEAVISFDKLIITIDPSKLLNNLKGQNVEYLNTTTLYFQTNTSILNSKNIALIADKNSVINNFCVLTDVVPNYSKNGKSLISVTLKEHSRNKMDVEHLAAIELKKYTGYAAPITLLERYDIYEALPINDFMKHDEQFTAFSLTNEIYLAGDYLLNGSLDAAMRSGRKAAQALLTSL